MHSLLRRQLKRCFPANEAFTGTWATFIEAVETAYRDFDDDRGMLERSLELSSQELLQANSEMRSLFQAIPDLLFRVDAKGKILSAKVGAGDDPLLLRSPAFPGRSIQATVLQAVGIRFDELLGQVLAKKTVQKLEFAFMSGSVRLFYEARLMPVLEQEALVIVRNITDYKEVTEQLGGMVSLLRSTIESTADGIMVVDLTGKLVSFNRRFGEMWLIPDDLLAKRSDELLLNHVLAQFEDPEAFLRGVREIYADVEAEITDFLNFKDGRIFERYSCPQRLAGVPVGRVWNFRDVTERRRLEEQFLQSQKMEAVGLLAGGVAHDFNNLLTVIQGSLSLFRMGGYSQAEQDKLVEDALRAAQKAANLTRQLLTFSRREPVELKPVELNEVVAEMTRLFQRLVGEHITMQTSYAPGGMPILADAGMIEQLLMNLVINSRDAMPKGGRLHLQTSNAVFEPHPKQSNPLRRTGRFVHLAVSDTGMGIAPEHLTKIFEPFFTTKEAGKGTGLGLATVFGIVQQHSGWIEVESRVGAGTTFHIYLPRLLRGNLDAKLREEAAPSLLGGAESILLVEDEEMVRHMMKDLLERYGYRVYPAESAVQALEFYKKNRPPLDLLVTDMIMPGGMSGRELGELIQAERPGMKVLFCSGHTDEVLGQNAAHRNNSAFLAKPFDAAKLIELIRKRLDAK